MGLVAGSQQIALLSTLSTSFCAAEGPPAVRTPLFLERKTHLQASAHLLGLRLRAHPAGMNSSDSDCGRAHELPLQLQARKRRAVPPGASLRCLLAWASQGAPVQKGADGIGIEYAWG